MRRERSKQKRGGSCSESHANPTKRHRAFNTNIPFDVERQALKALVGEAVGAVTEVEL